MEKLKNNKLLKFIWNTVYWLIVILTAATLLVVILQRTSNNTLSLGGFRIFNVSSRSMEPKYYIGDVLLSKSVNMDEIKVGDDVVYNGEKGDFAGKIVTHRVINIEFEENGQKIFHTQGIANEIEDPAITGKQIIGIAIGAIPVLSQITKVINNLYSFYFIIFVPMAILLCLELRKIVVYFFRKKD